MDYKTAKATVLRSGFQLDRNESRGETRVVSRRGKWRLVWDSAEPDDIYVREAINGFMVPARAKGVEVKPEDTLTWLDTLAMTTLDVLVPRWCEIKDAQQWVDCEFLPAHDRAQVAVWGRMTGKYRPSDPQTFYYGLAMRGLDVVGGLNAVLTEAAATEDEWDWTDPQTLLRVMAGMAERLGRLADFYSAILGHKGTHSLKPAQKQGTKLESIKPADNLAPSKRATVRPTFSAPAPKQAPAKPAFTPRYFRYDGPNFTTGTRKEPIRGGITIMGSPEFISTFDPKMGPVMLLKVESALASKKWVEISKDEYAAIERTQ